jgi:hypothetical protein
VKRAFQEAQQAGLRAPYVVIELDDEEGEEEDEEDE